MTTSQKRWTHSWIRLNATAWVVFCLASACAWAQTGFEGPPIDYFNAELSDPVAVLAQRLDSGEAQLEFDAEHGYLASVLKALDIPIDSQTLVFSKTSLQLQRISPRRPRAIYFSDDVYVGWCQRGDVIELAATDAKQGATFYTLKQAEVARPQFVRDRGQCLTCHVSNRTQYVPGYLVRSVFPNSMGHPIFGSGTYNTDQTSPLEERWGGWYVSGRHGRMRHMGNLTYKEENARRADREAGSNVESLESLVSTEPYLAPHSDIVALMVMEHQVQMHNAIAAANYETRSALHQSYQMNELLDRGEGFISDSAQRRIGTAADRVLKYLLMNGEYQLEDSISGTSGFSKEFAARGPWDSQGRSLRDLDLNHRLFRYPCSYLIYNPAFDALPDEVRHQVLGKLVDILTDDEDSSDDSGSDYRHLSAADRRAIREILTDTKPEFARLVNARKT